MGIITKPDDTTKDIVQEPRIEEGLLIVGVYMIVTILGTYVAFTRVQYTGVISGMDASAFASIILIGGIITAAAIALIGWPILTGICHILSMFFGGDGKFYPNMVTVIGYTAIPLIIVTIISIILSLMSPVTTVDLTSTQAATKSVFGEPLVLLGMLVTLLGSLWTAFVMAYAVKNGEKISMTNAYIIVGLLFIVNTLYTFSSLIFALIS